MRSVPPKVRVEPVHPPSHVSTNVHPVDLLSEDRTHVTARSAVYLGGMSEPYYGWALDAVNGLRWLVHVDDWAFAGAGENLRGRDRRIIDVAHVRWATTTAVTAIDLCVAELAVRYCGEPFWTDRMPTFSTVRKRLTGQSPSAASAWLDQVENDREYQVLRRGARDALAHRFLVRTALIGPGRTPFETERGAPPEERPDARELIVLALNVADRHVREFGRTLGSSRSPPPRRPA